VEADEGCGQLVSGSRRSGHSVERNVAALQCLVKHWLGRPLLKYQGAQSAFTDSLHIGTTSFWFDITVRCTAAEPTVPRFYPWARSGNSIWSIEDDEWRQRGRVLHLE